MKYYFTPEAFSNLKKELEELKTVKRREIAEKLYESKELGDLSENAQYQETKQEQLLLESKIEELEEMVKNAVIIKKNSGNGVVSLGSTITVKMVGPLKQKKIFTIVGSREAKPEEGKISNESPLGQAFLGQKKGAVVVVKTPKGEIKYKIEDIA